MWFSERELQTLAQKACRLFSVSRMVPALQADCSPDGPNTEAPHGNAWRERKGTISGFVCSHTYRGLLFLTRYMWNPGCDGNLVSHLISHGQGVKFPFQKQKYPVGICPFILSRKHVEHMFTFVDQLLQFSTQILERRLRRGLFPCTSRRLSRSQRRRAERCHLSNSTLGLFMPNSLMFSNHLSGTYSGKKKQQFPMKVYVVSVPEPCFLLFACICTVLPTSETKPLNFHVHPSAGWVKWAVLWFSEKTKEALNGFAAGCFPDGLLTTRITLLFVSNTHSCILGIAFLDKWAWEWAWAWIILEKLLHRFHFFCKLQKLALGLLRYKLAPLLQISTNQCNRWCAAWCKWIKVRLNGTTVRLAQCEIERCSLFPCRGQKRGQRCVIWDERVNGEMETEGLITFIRGGEQEQSLISILTLPFDGECSCRGDKGPMQSSAMPRILINP